MPNHFEQAAEKELGRHDEPHQETCRVHRLKPQLPCKPLVSEITRIEKDYVHQDNCKKSKNEKGQHLDA